MAGIDNTTGKVLSGWPHVAQSLRVIFTTQIGTRVLRRTFGSAVPSLLGRENLTPSVVLKFVTAIAIAIELWEPRYRLRAGYLDASTNSVDRLRQGQIGLNLQGDYRPNALQGDFTVAETGSVVI